MLPAGVTIGRITEGIQFGDYGPYRTKIISYKVGNDGPFSVEIPVADFTQEAFEAKIATDVAAMQAIRQTGA